MDSFQICASCHLYEVHGVAQVDLLLAICLLLTD